MTLQLSRSVAGKVVLVTGAGSGMGRATAEVFAAEGALVALTDLAGGAIEDIAADLRAKGHQARAWVLDVSDHDAIRAVVPEVAAAFGGLDVLVNNAGVSSFCPIDDDDHYELVWDRAVAVLLTAHQRMIRAALPFLRQSSSPRIVNIASTEALGATARNSPYAAAKAGLRAVVRIMAKELLPQTPVWQIDFVALNYLAFVTLTTTGYGDIHPGTPQTQMLCALVAIAGTTYQVVVMGLLIGRFTAQDVGQVIEEDNQDHRR